MVLNSNQKLPKDKKGKKYIFLAGSIDTSEHSSWRKRVVGKVTKFNFLDPTNKNYNELNNEEMVAHINWELEALSMADIIIINFLPNALSPISLVELGLYVASKKLIVVCPKEFYRSKYVFTLCKKYERPFYFKLDEALKKIKN